MLQKVFEMYDKNKDGQTSEKELFDTTKRHGKEMTMSQIKSLIKSADRNGKFN